MSAAPILGLVILALLAAVPAGAGPEEDAQSRLIAHGFENVAVQVGGSRATVWFENRIHRYEMTALGTAAILAGSAWADQPDRVLELVPRNRGIPILALSARVGDWRAFLRGDMSPEAFRRVLSVRMGAPAPPRSFNPSYRRVDLSLRPLFSFQLGILDAPFQSTLSAAPEATGSLFPGLQFNIQGILRVQDDLDPCGDEEPCGPLVRPGRTTLSWGGWVPGDWLVSLSAGYFATDDRYGIAGQAGTFLWDGAVELWGGGDVSGRLQFLTEVVNYSGLTQWSGFGAVTVRVPGVDLAATGRAGRFREEQWGVRFDLDRRFHEFEIGFFGIRNEVDAVVGINLELPLPVRRHRQPSTVRVKTVDTFPFTYRESVEPVGLQVSLFDDLDRLRKRLSPVFIRNNLTDLRRAGSVVAGELEAW